ncbi:MAG: hypothetical protein AAGD14_05275 [Planctomycetota bacterium]
MRILACLLLGFATALAGPVDRILMEARQAERVRGDMDGARRLYLRALEDKSVGRAQQAAIRVRIAHCLARMGETNKALGYLEPSIYAHAEIPDGTRREAERLRARLQPRAPADRPDTPRTGADEQEIERKVRQHLADARRFLDRRQLVLAYASVKNALELAPSNADARALDAQIQTRLTGVAAVLESPLDFLRAWSDAQVKSVAREARGRMVAGLRAYRDGRYPVGEREFGAAIALIDGCEYADASTELLDLRETVRERWRSERERRLGPEKAEPTIPTRVSKVTPAADYLRQLQRMLDVLSSPEYEYRLVPVTPRARIGRTVTQRKPRGFVLEYDATPTAWTLADFALEHLRRTVDPDSWTRRGNFLDTAGEMLVARNRPAVLDRLERTLETLEQPVHATIPTDFLLVSVPAPLLDRFAKQFGAWTVARRGADPVLTRVVPRNISLDRILGWFNDQRVQVRPEDDLYSTVLDNGRGTTLLAGLPLANAPGYLNAPVRGLPPIQRLYGVLLDILSWQGEDGASALSLRVNVRQPLPPLRAGTREALPRFLTQSTRLYADLGKGGTLVVGGLANPFVEGSTLMLILRHRDRNAREAPAGRGTEFEFGMRRLLFDVHTDDPGPRRAGDDGLVATSPFEALRQRAAFLEKRLKQGLPNQPIELDWEEAVLRVPESAREAAELQIQALEEEAKRTYLVEVETRVVRTPVAQRWLDRTTLKLQSWGDVQLASMRTADARALMRQLPEPITNGLIPTQSRFAALGLQTRHLRATRTRSRADDADVELAQPNDFALTEGLVLRVRPYMEQARIVRADVDIVTAGVEPEGGRVGGVKASGALDFGTRTRPQTAVLCRIPHPIESRPDQLIEIVVALRVTLRSAR